MYYVGSFAQLSFKSSNKIQFNATNIKHNYSLLQFYVYLIDEITNPVFFFKICRKLDVFFTHTSLMLYSHGLTSLCMVMFVIVLLLYW